MFKSYYGRPSIIRTKTVLKYKSEVSLVFCLPRAVQVRSVNSLLPGNGHPKFIFKTLK